MGQQPTDDSYDANETKQRMEAAIRKALNTPHKPHATPKKKPKSKRRPTKPKSA
jgi:hypothetical protein